MIEFTSRNARAWSRLGSCGAFGLAAVDLAEDNEKIVMLTADLTFFSGLERFKNAYPDRIFNCGIAEQNMIGVAAGMAKEGFVPFATTYGTFASMRCADQVRVNMGYMNLPVKLIGLTSGLSVGILGPTHISTEDIAVFRSIPNIDILSPADCMETIKAVQAAAKTDRPTYIRLTGTTSNPAVYKDDYEFIIGKAIKLKEGDDLTIIATGTMVHMALQVAERMQEFGISIEVIDMHTIKPIDEEAILGASGKAIVTLEEHSIIGGLGSAVNDCLIKAGNKKSCLNLGLSDEYKHAADYTYLLNSYGLSVDTIVNKIRLFVS